ncbi:hypothetical protein LUZ62_020969 [Rhynchospora pubera]|uniref:Uncharacterized protein n=1 Tax=Rhynchospora pubera TaxID=906938 RepID=A0AAV8GZH1_9POAL|nr:hypothetical protein LUZ62_020969 [Rhynchospora pubera]
MPRIPRIKFPQRHLPKSSATPAPSDQNLFFASQQAKSQPTVPASAPGEKPSYRFKSDVPAAPSNSALGGKASLLPKRTPVTEEEIDVIMVTYKLPLIN